MPFRMSHGEHVCVLWRCRDCSLDSFTLIKIIVLLHNESVYVIIIACNIFISTYLKKKIGGDVVGAKFAHA